VAVALLLVAIGLRAPIVAASPLLHEIQSRLDLSSAEAGLLTTLPVLCFGVFSPLAPLLARRWSMELVIFGSTVVLLGAIALRLVPSTLLLFGGTLLAGVAIAIGNVLLPALIKRDFPKNGGTMTAAYVTALTLGAALPAGLTVPLERAAGLDWRAALAMWGFFPVLALLMWIPQLRSAHRIAGPAHRIPLRALLRDPVAWYVTAFMGMQSLGFYTTTAWLPTLFVSHGMDARSAGWLLSVANIIGIPAVLLVPIVIVKLRRQTPFVLGMAVMYTIALIGLLLDPVPLALLWMALLGLAQSATISLAMSFILLRSPDAAYAAQLSSMSQGAGYMLAALGPFLFGALRDASSGWALPLIALLFFVIVPLALSGVAAARPRFVGSARAA
jgi:MFS transporter, CP family, cyanate transporter